LCFGLGCSCLNIDGERLSECIMTNIFTHVAGLAEKNPKMLVVYHGVIVKLICVYNYSSFFDVILAILPVSAKQSFSWPPGHCSCILQSTRDRRLLIRHPAHCTWLMHLQPCLPPVWHLRHLAHPARQAKEHNLPCSPSGSLPLPGGWSQRRRRFAASAAQLAPAQARSPPSHQANPSISSSTY
jgi:hypothetical protein